MPPTAWIRYVPAVHGPDAIEELAPPLSAPVTHSAARHERPVLWEPTAEAIRVSRVPAARPRRRP